MTDGLHSAVFDETLESVRGQGFIAHVLNCAKALTQKRRADEAFFL